MTNKYKWTILITAVLLLIIVPFCIWGEQIDHFVILMIEKGQEYPIRVGIFLAALLAGDIILPTPSSIMSTGCGAVLGFFWGTLVSFIGMTISCVSGYLIGRYASKHFVRRLMGNTMKSLETFNIKYGRWCLLLTRAVPILAEASVLFAGLGKQKISDFLTITAMANLVISLLYAYIGSNAVSTNAFLLVFAVGILIPGIFMIISQILSKKKDI